MTRRDEFKTIVQSILNGDKRGLRSFHVDGSSDHFTYEIEHGQEMDSGDRLFVPREITVELVDRMLRSRWARWDGYAMAIRPATNEDMTRLQQLHASCVNYCECGPGWHDLINAVFQWVEELGETEWQSSQIKQKYGGLRVYYDGYPGDFGDMIIEAAEIVSFHTCEECGAPGTLRDDGYRQALCDECAKACGR